MRIVNRKISTLRIFENKIQLSGLKKMEFSFRWLRDNCQCSECLHPSTQQKLHSTGQIQSVAPIKADLESGVLKLKWPMHSISGQIREHDSEFNIDWLAKYRYRAKTRTLFPAEIKWDRESLTKAMVPVRFEEFSSPSGFRKALNMINLYGICFLKSVPTVDDCQVEQIGKKFGHLQETFYGGSWNVKSDINSKNIAYTSLHLGLHMDLMYIESPPGLQLLHCLENTVVGGTSLFVDIFNAVDELKLNNPREFEILARVPVRFHYVNDGKHYEYNRPTICKDFTGDYKIFYSPPFQGPLNVHVDDADDFYSAFAIFEQLISQEKYLYKYLMKPGDCVLFSNRRVLHGREAFKPDSGTRWLKGAYVGLDEIENCIRIAK